MTTPTFKVLSDLPNDSDLFGVLPSHPPPLVHRKPAPKGKKKGRDPHAAIAQDHTLSTRNTLALSPVEVEQMLAAAKQLPIKSRRLQRVGGQ